MVVSSPFGDFVAGGPRATDPAGYALVIEAIREGYLLHYGEPRLFVSAIDPDLALLAGDFLYALGLERLSSLGDPEAVRQLADLISLQAVIHDSGPELSSEDTHLDQALWLASTVAVAFGTSDDYEAMKGEIPAVSAPFALAGRILDWADGQVDGSGVGEAWARVREQVGFEVQ